MSSCDIVERLHSVPAGAEDNPRHGHTHSLRPGLRPVTDPQVDLELVRRGPETLTGTSRPRAGLRGHGQPGLPACPRPAPVGSDSDVIKCSANQRSGLAKADQ